MTTTRLPCREYGKLVGFFYEMAFPSHQIICPCLLLCLFWLVLHFSPGISDLHQASTMVLLTRIRCALRVVKMGGQEVVVDKMSLVAAPFKPASQIKIEDLIQRDSVVAARPFHPCSVFFNRTLSVFINKGTRKGQKSLMRDLMRETFCLIKQTQLAKYHECQSDEERGNIECDPLVIFLGALENCKPLLITRPVKRGGATYQVPFPLSAVESQDLAIRWLFQTIKERPKPRKQYFPEVMARELIDCFNNEGKVVKKKQDIHKQCEANKAYAHYRWNWTAAGGNFPEY